MKRIISLILILILSLLLPSCATPEPEKETYLVTFNPDNGDIPTSISVEEGELVPRPTTPVKEGFDFVGWYVGEEEWLFDASAVVKNTLISAKWREKTPIVPDGGNGSDSGDTEKDDNEDKKEDGNTEITVIPDGGLDTSVNVTIKLYHTINQYYRPALEAAIAEFESDYPSIDVIAEFCGSGQYVAERAMIEIEGENEGAVAFAFAEHLGRIYGAGLSQSMDVFINHEEMGLAENTFIESAVEEGKSFGDGKTHFLPIGQNCDLLFYNNTFFEKYSLSVPETMEELVEVCEAIKSIDPRIIPLGIDSASNLYLNLLAQSTGEASPHLASAPETLKMLRELYTKGWVTTSDIEEQYMSALFGTSCPMSISSPSSARYMFSNDFDTGIAPIPQLYDNEAIVFRGTGFMPIKSKDPNVSVATWLLIKHLTTSSEFTFEYCKGNSVIPTDKSIISGKYLDHLFVGLLVPETAPDAYASYVMLEESLPYAVFSKPNPYGADTHTTLSELVYNVMMYDGTDVDAYITDQLALCHEKLKKQDN